MPGGFFSFCPKEVNITKRNTVFRFTDQEIETAKITDLPDLLEPLGCHVKRVGQFSPPAKWTAHGKDGASFKRVVLGSGKSVALSCGSALD